MTIFTYSMHNFKNNHCSDDCARALHYREIYGRAVRSHCSVHSALSEKITVRAVRSLRKIYGECCTLYRIIYINIWGLLNPPHIYIYKKSDVHPDFLLSKFTVHNFWKEV